MFAPSTPQRTSIITPLIDPTAQQSLMSLFFGKDHRTKKVSDRHMRKHMDSISVPKPVTVPGLGTVVSRREGQAGRNGTRVLVREVTEEETRVRRSKSSRTGVVRETVTKTSIYANPDRSLPVRPRTAGPGTRTRMKSSYLKETNSRSYSRSYCTIPLKTLTGDGNPLSLSYSSSSPLRASTLFASPLSTTVAVREEEEPDYANSVDRIAIPPGFVKCEGTEMMTKEEVVKSYQESG